MGFERMMDCRRQDRKAGWVIEQLCGAAMNQRAYCGSRIVNCGAIPSYALSKLKEPSASLRAVVVAGPVAIAIAVSSRFVERVCATRFDSICGAAAHARRGDASGREKGREIKKRRTVKIR